MLSKPKSGWTCFQLNETSEYGLSYLDDIAFEWLDDAIHGLKELRPFCVKGFMEPHRFLCTVSYWNCHIVWENDGRCPLKADNNMGSEVSHTSMLEFCEYLYEDIAAHIDEWVSFVDYRDCDIQTKKAALEAKLNQLKKLISEKEFAFDEQHAFL